MGDLAYLGGALAGSFTLGAVVYLIIRALFKAPPEQSALGTFILLAALGFFGWYGDGSPLTWLLLQWLGSAVACFAIGRIGQYREERRHRDDVDSFH